MLCPNSTRAKKLPVSISGSKWSVGGLDSQGLSGFTDNFCTRFFTQRVALSKA